MRTLGIIALTIALLIGGAVAWYKISYPTYTYRYRMTVEVEVGGKLRSGESVIEVRIAMQPSGGGIPPYKPHVRGEAVFVDLGEGRNVIALLAAGPLAADVNYPDYIVPNLFNVQFENWATLSDMRGTKEVPLSKLPTFVTFSDLGDPNTARVVSPHEFEKVFGPDVHLKRVTIEMLGEGVTRKIKEKISWIGNYTLETIFERKLREPERGQGPSMTPGLNLKRE